MRQKASRRQGGGCFWCNVDLAPAHLILDNSATGDHLLPRSKGGQHHQNIVASCRKCNLARADQPLAEWLKRVKFRLEKAGNLHFFATILSRLLRYGISLDVPITSVTQTASRPPPMDTPPAPQGLPGVPQKATRD